LLITASMAEPVSCIAQIREMTVFPL